jgi:hypothetical protein
MFAVEMGGKIVAWNQALVAATKRDANSAMGQPLLSLCSLSDSLAVPEAVLLASRIGKFDLNVTLLSDATETGTMMLSGSLVRVYNSLGVPLVMFVGRTRTSAEESQGDGKQGAPRSCNYGETDSAVSKLDMTGQQPVYLPRIKAITIPDELHILHKVREACSRTCDARIASPAMHMRVARPWAISRGRNKI